jgi:hypothetical protein
MTRPIVNGARPRRTISCHGGDCSDRPTEPRSNASCYAHDIRPGHELAQSQDFGELLIVHPPLLFDDNTARPDEPTVEPEKGDLEEVDKQRSERDPLRKTSRVHRMGHNNHPSFDEEL